MGIVFAFACIYFISSISVIALGTGSVILGIAVNYSPHVFNHYRHTGSALAVIKDLLSRLPLAALPPLAVFAPEFVKLGLLQDLGLFAAFSLIGAALCSPLFFCHILLLLKRPAYGYMSHS